MLLSMRCDTCCTPWVCTDGADRSCCPFCGSTSVTVTRRGRLVEGEGTPFDQMRDQDAADRARRAA